MTATGPVVGGTPAYDAVYAFIHTIGDNMPEDVVHRNAMIWHVVNLALDAMDREPLPERWGIRFYRRRPDGSEVAAGWWTEPNRSEESARAEYQALLVLRANGQGVPGVRHELVRVLAYANVVESTGYAEEARRG